MNRRNFLKYASITPVSALILPKQETQASEKTTDLNQILHRFHNGNIHQIIQSINHYGSNIVTSIGSISLSAFDVAFKMIENTGNLPILIVVSPSNYRNISMYYHQCLNANKLWNVEILIINSPSLKNNIIILPNSNDVNNASMINIL